MNKLNGKKLLILGGKPIGSTEIVATAKEMGVYTIVTDYLPNNESPAKKIADEVWNVSTADIERLALMAKENRVDGVYTGVHEFNIKQMIKLCNMLDFPCYCTMDQWDALENKDSFKKECRKFGIPVTKDFDIVDGDFSILKEEDYPVITKPVDGSGSRGFSICSNINDLKCYYEKAKQFSDSGNILVESFMDYRYSVIINYTIIDGKVIYCGMSDKRSRKVFENGAPIMSFQIYPSEFEKNFVSTLNDSTIDMLSSFGLKNGVVWIEAFSKNGNFVFNEIGYRFGGSLTYYPVKYYYGIDQLKLQLEFALSGENDKVIPMNKANESIYCIFPTHVKSGQIANIKGLSTLEKKNYFQAYVPVHCEGDVIQNWGSAQQVLAYIHYIANSVDEAKRIQEDIMNILSVEDVEGNSLLFNLVDEYVFNLHL